MSQIDLSIYDLDQPDAKGRMKTQIVPLNGSFDFLGLRFNKRTIHPSEKKIHQLRERIREITDVRANPEANLIDVVIGLNRLLEGWVNAYNFTDLPPALLVKIDHESGTSLAAWMLFHDLIRSLNALDSKTRTRIGLVSATDFQIHPLSRKIASDN